MAGLLPLVRRLRLTRSCVPALAGLSEEADDFGHIRVVNGHTLLVVVGVVQDEATALVGAIAMATMETSGMAMGRSFKSATSILDCLRNTKWDLFEGVSHLGDERKTQADLLLQDVRSAISTDELALAGGLPAKLSDSESRAIKLLTPPKPPIDPPPPPPKKGWKQVGTGSQSRLSHEESLTEAKGLIEKLEQNPKLRLTIHWTLEEESE